MNELTFLLSRFWRLDIWDQGIGRAGFLWGLSPWLVDGRLLTESSHVFFPLPLPVPKFPVHNRIRIPPHDLNQLLKSPVIFWGARGWDFSMIISCVYNSAHRNFLEKILCKEDKPGSSWRRLCFLIFFFFPLIFISWRLITLQYCSGFCHTLTWISHGFICIPHPAPPLPGEDFGVKGEFSLWRCGNLVWLPTEGII